MLKIIKNAKVFSPKYIGQCDLLFDKEILYIDNHIDLSNSLDIEIYDAKGLYLIPGLIDPHVHIVGGGGEGGFVTRTPELKISDCIKNGITTVIGCLGTDGITRSLEDLYAKAKAMELEGLNTFIYTGSYRIPPITFTGSIMKDLILIDKVIGVGELAISDHRSSQPTFEELLRIVADTRVGGMLSGKPGIVNFHIGDGERGIDYLFDIVDKTEIPISHLYPTHMNRNKKLFKSGLEFAKKGGVIDLTALQPGESGERSKGNFTTVDCVLEAFENGLLDSITISSDGQGSLPRFDEKGNFTGLSVGSVGAILYTLRKVVEKGVPIEEAIKVATVNQARIFNLNKGCISQGYDADFVLIDFESWSIRSVVSKGQFLLKDEVMKSFTFE
jgi:beta-aspartyl-dipeptidase (metallo-type)